MSRALLNGNLVEYSEQLFTVHTRKLTTQSASEAPIIPIFNFPLFFQSWNFIGKGYKNTFLNSKCLLHFDISMEICNTLWSTMFFKCPKLMTDCTLSRDRPVLLLATHLIQTMSCTFLQVCLSYIFLWKKMTLQHGKRLPNPSKWFMAASCSRIAQCNSSVQTSCTTTLTSDLWHWSGGLISPLQFVHKKNPGILISKAGQGLSGCG